MVSNNNIPDRVIPISTGEMIEGLKKIKLKGFPNIQPYQKSFITVELLDPNYLHPVQNYCLKSELLKIKKVRNSLFSNFGVDILGLNSAINVLYGEDTISILPVIVEEHIGADGHIYNLIADGAHRSMVARLEQRLLSCIYIRGISKTYRYYSNPRPNGWEGIEILESIPEGYLKKWYPMENAKDYYRDFNSSIFQNVGQGRGYSGV